MPSNSLKDLLTHKYIIWAIGGIVVIGLGSAAYFLTGTAKPSAVNVNVSATGTSSPVTASGVVEPLQNPDLSFASQGRVAAVNVKAGDHVYAGETLASLDIAALIAQRNQAAAGEVAAKAKLQSLQNPPRQTDVAVKQAAVDQSKQTLANAYADIPAALSDTVAKATDAVRLDSDIALANADTVNPQLLFTTTDSASARTAIADRVTVGAELKTWNTEVAGLSAPSTADLDAALTNALAHLTVVRQYENDLYAALLGATPSSSFSATQIATAQASVSSARSAVNALITALTDKKQALQSDALLVATAQATLNQFLAGASSEDIQAAQASLDQASASVDAVNAQIANNIISAPFSGTVGSVSIKAGELASANTPAITLVPAAALQVTVYVTEIDVTRLRVGDAADVTLDAFGSDRHFAAHVATLDTAPSQVNGVSAYKVTLAFDASEPDAKTGMTANATIQPATQNAQ